MDIIGKDCEDICYKFQHNLYMADILDEMRESSYFKWYKDEYLEREMKYPYEIVYIAEGFHEPWHMYSLSKYTNEYNKKFDNDIDINYGTLEEKEFAYQLLTGYKFYAFKKKCTPYPLMTEIDYLRHNGTNEVKKKIEKFDKIRGYDRGALVGCTIASSHNFFL